MVRLGVASCLAAPFPFFSQDLPTEQGASDLAVGLKCGLTWGSWVYQTGAAGHRCSGREDDAFRMDIVDI